MVPIPLTDRPAVGGVGEGDAVEVIEGAGGQIGPVAAVCGHAHDAGIADREGVRGVRTGHAVQPVRGVAPLRLPVGTAVGRAVDETLPGPLILTDQPADLVACEGDRVEHVAVVGKDRCLGLPGGATVGRGEHGGLADSPAVGRVAEGQVPQAFGASGVHGPPGRAPVRGRKDDVGAADRPAALGALELDAHQDLVCCRLVLQVPVAPPSLVAYSSP